MDDIDLLIDLHKSQNRQGPGGEDATAQAVALAKLSPSTPLRIADIGCGTGGPTLQLAQSLTADITAVDFLADFIDVLKDRADAAGLADKITPLVCSMEDLPFGDDDFDVLWSEGAVYNMGFKNGVNAWRRFLKPGGMLVVSEITWTTRTRPQDLQDYWDTNYPEIGTASAKMAVLEEAGYAPTGYFVLPESCWLENYYVPLQAAFPAFLDRHADTPAAAALVDAEREEIALYEKYKAYCSYGVYVAQKRD